MEEEDKSVMKASSFLLFEASGDSESVSDTLLPEIEDDDACSCTRDPRKLQGRGDFDGFDAQSFGEDEEEQEQEQEEMDEELIDEDIGTLIGSGRSSASVESTKMESELLNEVEKSRLFWETCLAS